MLPLHDGNQIGKAGMISLSVVTPLQHQNKKNIPKISQSHQRNFRLQQPGKINAALVEVWLMQNPKTSQRIEKNIHFKSEAYHQSPSDKNQRDYLASYLEQRNIPVGSQKTHIQKSLHSLFFPRIFKRFAASQLRWRGGQKPGLVKTANFRGCEAQLIASDKICFLFFMVNVNV